VDGTQAQNGFRTHSTRLLDHVARSTESKAWNPPRIRVLLEAVAPLNVGRLRGVAMCSNSAFRARGASPHLVQPVRRHGVVSTAGLSRERGIPIHGEGTYTRECREELAQILARYLAGTGEPAPSAHDAMHGFEIERTCPEPDPGSDPPLSF
jgi:hypothetical protein